MFLENKIKKWRQALKKNILYCIVFILTLIAGGVSHASSFSEHLAVAQQALVEENYEKAAQSFKQALSSRPTDLRVRFNYAKALYKLEDFNLAARQLRTLLRNSPNNIMARELYAKILVESNEKQAALKQIDRLLQHRADYPVALQLRKKLLDKSNEIEEKEFVEQKIEVESVINHASDIQSKASALKPQQLPLRKKILASVTPKEIESYDVASFLQKTQDSFLVNLEYAKFALEAGDISRAIKALANAEKLARNKKDSQRFIEVQILNSLVHIYNLDFKAYGQNLFRLRDVMTKQAYQSFLNVFNQGFALEKDCDRARLAAGIAMGAGHYTIAANLFSQALQADDEDILLIALLSEAQLQSLDYAGAESTLKKIAEIDSESTEPMVNLARFYITAFYKPEKAVKYAQKALEKSFDPRAEVVIALVDYTKGNIKEGIERIKSVVDKLEDENFKSMCENIIADGEYVGASSENKIDFVKVLALPGAEHSPLISYRHLGDEKLRAGSVFKAMRYYMLADETAEIGRVYLALAAALAEANELEYSSIASGYGLRALKEELEQNPENSRASLYLAIYLHESGNKVKAIATAKKGLDFATDSQTERQLMSLINAMN